MSVSQKDFFLHLCLRTEIANETKLLHFTSCQFQRLKWIKKNSKEILNASEIFQKIR